MVLGQYNAKVDSKGRVAFPKKLREEFGRELIITFGYEHSLIIVSRKHWEKLLEGTLGKPFLQKEVREIQRFLLGGASLLDLDTKGRLLVPSYLKEFGLLKKEAIFLGLHDYVELWDKKRWEEYRGILQDTIGAVSNRLLSKNKEEQNG